MRICYDRSAAHSAQWQDLELILRWFLQDGNRRARRERVADASLRPAETFPCACLMPTEAVRFRLRQLIVAVVQRFLRYAYAGCFRVIQTRKTLCTLRTCIRKQ